MQEETEFGGVEERVWEKAEKVQECRRKQFGGVEKTVRESRRKQFGRVVETVRERSGNSSGEVRKQLRRGEETVKER